jgi:hypothetical protein
MTTETDKVQSWPAGRSVLEAATCQLARCQECGAFMIVLEARDGAPFARAHLGDNSARIGRWFADSLKAN